MTIRQSLNSPVSPESAPIGPNQDEILDQKVIANDQAAAKVYAKKFFVESRGWFNFYQGGGK